MRWSDFFSRPCPHDRLFRGVDLQSVSFRTLGTFNVPVVPPGQVVTGLMVAPDNVYRHTLRVKLSGPVGAKLFISNREQVSQTDYFLDLETPQELASGPLSTRALFVASNVAGCTVTLAETA